MVTLVFGLVSRDAQNQLGKMSGRLYDEAFMSMSYLRSAQNDVMAISRDIAAGSAGTDELNDQFDNAIGNLSIAIERALSAEGTSAAQWLSQRLRQIATDFRTSNRLPDRLTLAEIERRFDTAVEINAGDGFRSRRLTTELVQRLSLQTWTAMALSIATALAITLLLSRAIVPALRHAVAIAIAIADGRLDNRIETKGSSETSILLRALATMQRSIADKIAQIQQLLADQARSHASEMASQHARFETALDNMVQALCMFDDCGRLLVHNRRFADMFGVVAAGAAAKDVLPPLLSSTADSGGRCVEARAFTKQLDDERTIAVTETPMAEGGWIATYEDITERLRVEARMSYMARHDALTGLPNRVLYKERMDQALAEARRGGGLAVLCLDLDHFKSVNDTLGHSIGDALLQQVAQRVVAEIRETDMAVRLGGDEFVIIQSGAIQPGRATALAERLVQLLGEPFQVGDHQIAIGTSIGIAITNDGLTTAETMLKSADLALYRAKADGRGTYRFFEAEMDARMQERRLLEIDLRRAITERQFENFYQPLVTVDTREVSGFEALVRWRHPTRGLVFPSAFIAVAEETGLITKIGSLVLEQACIDALAWPAHVKIAVNLSPLQFRNRNFAAEVEGVLRRSGLPASRLELEITESILLQDSEAILSILHELRALGVQISMDDFGTGYSSLSYLRRFPFDKIKIDQSFIRNLEESGDCIAIVRAVLGLGKSLGMRVVAEGVETADQLAILHEEGCEQVQGYLFSKPRPVEALTAMFGKEMAAAE